MTVVCVLIPRFELAVAAGGRAELLKRPAALGPEPGRESCIGEVSLAAAAHGVRARMRLGEALARCPTLALIPPDPVGVADEWELVIGALERVGAAVESERPGLACFAAGGLLRLHGGLENVIAAARREVRRPVRIGAGPSRFCALAAASQARPRRPEIFTRPESDLAQLPVALLHLRAPASELPEALERLGIATLGDLAALPRAALADRFGAAGLVAHDLAQGRDTPLLPRAPGQRLEETLDLPESTSGTQLERALGMLIDRLLARRERRNRTLRTVALAARLVEGGTWRERVVFREALADPERMRLALGNHLASLPAPAESLRLVVERFGPPAADQQPLLRDGPAQRDARLREAVRQVRAAAGAEAALRVLPVDPDSRIPERRAVLAPFEA
ncbi:MAG: protein ImuB [Solirubrobacteraceae bacterium]|jgi:protein ImuB|nr:protein ImuB [Solirubrobacteraceae bacterium]